MAGNGQRDIGSFFKKAPAAAQPVAGPSRQLPQDDPEELPDAYEGQDRLPQVEDVGSYGLRRKEGEWRSKKPHESVAQGQIVHQLGPVDTLQPGRHPEGGQSSSRPSSSGNPFSDESFEPSSDANLYNSDPVDWDEYDFREDVAQVFDIGTGEWVMANGTEDEFDEVRIGPMAVKLAGDILQGADYQRVSAALVVEEARRQICRSRTACLEILNKVKKVRPADGWCVLADMQPSKEGGYVQVSYQGHNKILTLQEVSVGASGLQLGADVEGSHWQQASHRCCKPKCTTVGHVVVESHEQNGLRKNCLVWVHCPHCLGTGEAKAILVCPHAPCCVKHHPAYKSLESFLQNGVCAVSREAFATGLYNDEFDARTGLRRQEGAAA